MVFSNKIGENNWYEEYFGLHGAFFCRMVYSYTLRKWKLFWQRRGDIDIKFESEAAWALCLHGCLYRESTAIIYRVSQTFQGFWANQYHVNDALKSDTSREGFQIFSWFTLVMLWLIYWNVFLIGAYVPKMWTLPKIIYLYLCVWS